MTQRILLFGRAAGTLLSGPLVFLAALLVEVVRQVKNTVLATWYARPEDPEAAKKREALERHMKDVQDAARRREERRLEAEGKRREQEAVTRIIGAIREEEAE